MRKMTRALTENLLTLKEHKILYKRTDMGTPYNYAPKEYKDMEFDHRCYFEDGSHIYNVIVNAQSLSKLVLMGYAKWSSSKKETVEYIDRVDWAIKFLEKNGYVITKEPRFQLDKDSICYGCNNCAEDGGCDAIKMCVGGNMNDYIAKEAE